MELIIDGEQMLLSEDASLSIEKNNPILNDSAGDFSYPFPVSMLNSPKLNNPGRLTRVGILPTQTFTLKELGKTVLRGDVGYDKVGSEIGLVLKSGYSKYKTIAQITNMTSLNLGLLSIWDGNVTDTELAAAIADLDAYNNNEGLFDASIAPCAIKNGTSQIEVNKVNSSTGNLVVDTGWSTYTKSLKLYLDFQFKVRWLFEEVFKAIGFTVIKNEFAAVSNVFRESVIFGNPILVNGYWVRDGQGTYLTKRVTPNSEIALSDLMPDMKVFDFMENLRVMFCLHFSFNNNTVDILNKNDVFSATKPVINKKLIEITGREHDAKSENTGYALIYGSQDNSDDTEEDFIVTDTTMASTLPTPEYENQVILFNVTERYYIAKLDENDDLYWSRIGRLKALRSGNQDDPYETTIDVKIPEQVLLMGAEGPLLNVSMLSAPGNSGVIAKLSSIYASIYRGKDQLSGLTFPLLCAEAYTLGDDSLSYNIVGYPGANLQPQGLITLHDDYLEFNQNAVGFTKYFQCSLSDLLAIDMSRRLSINGLVVIFNKINLDLPYNGRFKAEGYTAIAT